MKNYNEVRDRIPRTVRGQDGRILPSLGANEIARFVEFHRSCFVKKVKWIITWQEPMGPCTQLQKIVTYREVFRFAGVVAPGFINIVNKLGKLSGFFIFCFLKLLPKQLKEDCILRLEQSNRAGNEKAQFFYHLSPAVTKFDRRPGFKVKWRALLRTAATDLQWDVDEVIKCVSFFEGLEQCSGIFLAMKSFG